MSQRRVLKSLWDIQHACRLVLEFTQGKDFVAYESDALLRSGVERQLEIAAEALIQLLKVDPSLADTISDVPRIISFRNRLVHRYFEIDNALVWRIVEVDVPTLLREVEQLREERSGSPESGGNSPQ
jgi:uncharacterized protein with HEPN domain